MVQILKNFFLKLKFLSICPNKSNWPYSDLFSYKCVVVFFCFLTQTLLVMQWISYLVTEWIYFFGHTDTSFFAKTSYHYMYVVLGLAQDVHCNVFDHLLNVLASHLSWDVVIYHIHSYLDSYTIDFDFCAVAHPISVQEAHFSPWF